MFDKNGKYIDHSMTISRPSYFAFIPVFKKRKKGTLEKNVIRVIHESNICGSNPIIKTILIENVRICCIIFESSGKQSLKVICASAPLMLSLIAKANPNFANFLKDEKVSSCLNALRGVDFEPLLDSFCHTTITVYNGAKQIYPTVYANFVKDSFLNGERRLLYSLKIVFKVLQSGFKFMLENAIPLFQYLYNQNFAFVSYVADSFVSSITYLVKYSTAANGNSRKTFFFTIRYIKKIVQSIISFLNISYKDSTLYYWLKQLHLLLKVSFSCLRSNEMYLKIEEKVLHIFDLLKPYLWQYCTQLFAVVKNIVMPVLKSTIRIVINESAPFLQKLMDDNLDAILNAYNTAKTFLCENIHYVKPFCCYTCHFLHDSIWYIYNVLETTLPILIQLSSETVISSITSSLHLLEYLCKKLYKYVVFIVSNKKQLVCDMSQKAVLILKAIYNFLVKIQPYMVRIFQTIFNEFAGLIHVVSPTLIACFYEVNSSAFHASREVIGKSCLAVKRVTPSFYYSIKKALPPTILAVSELMKSSKNSVVIISPTVFKCAISVFPEVKDGLIVLLADGNKACIEIISASYSASLEIKYVAKSVTCNIPVVYKAVNEVLVTTACATVEVSTTSLNAKRRIFKDMKKARETVHTSFMLAEREMVAAYKDLVSEIDYIMPKSEESKTRVDIYFAKIICLLYCICLSSLKDFNNVLAGSAKGMKVYAENFHADLVHTCCYLCILAISIITNALKIRMSHSIQFCENLSKLLWVIVKTNPYINKSSMTHFMNTIFHIFSFVNDKIFQFVHSKAPIAWVAFKCHVTAVWLKFCLLSLQLWINVEVLAPPLWFFIIENVPGAWIVWKRFCTVLWNLLKDAAPHFWSYLSTTACLLWPSGRELIKELWKLFTCTSGFVWQGTILLSSEYWLISETHLPRVWFIGCNKTKRAWIITCSLMERCWNFIVETCSLSWNVLHRTIANSWRTGLVFTKSAYCIITTTASMLQKSFCVYSNTKNRMSVLLQIKSIKPIIRDFTACFQAPKLRNFAQLSDKLKLFWEFIFEESSDLFDINYAISID